MRFSIKIKSFLIAAALMIPVSSLSAFAEEENNFTYTIINNEATIIGYTGEPVYLEIPETVEGCPVTQIRDNAFFSCTSLRQISLPSSIKKIGHHTFYACNSLESIVLPAQLEEIGMGAFNGCNSLSAINIPASLEVLPESCFRSCSSLTEVVLPGRIMEIGDFCFSGCSALSYVSLPESTRKIGAGAFYSCGTLESLYIPPSVETIKYEAVGYENTGSDSLVQSDFVIMGKSGSAAEDYADDNGLEFSKASEALQSPVSSSAKLRKVPMWILLLLSCGGTGFFALSCVIAVKQHRYEKKKSLESD
ncbi:MAG: leucine-rich repeat domain-containing protein [Ruminococcus sp.]|nr:leucine-rich repeat domain-containing protein [Ruminococcus sp.]